MKELETTFFNLSTVKLPVHAGDLLVAQPFLDDDWFERAVISIIDYDKIDGATAVVLNNDMGYTLDEVLSGIGDAGKNVKVYCGGPLSRDRLYFIHTLGPEIIPNAREYGPGLYIGGDFTHAVAYVNDGYPCDGLIRFFVGYTGWSVGQLEQEIDEDTWAVLPIGNESSRFIVGSGDAVWHRAVKEMGDEYRSWSLIPRDIQSN
ncbi:MAG: YqgE/AlgH family protein [Odoribacter sp.]|nr:YqgE/AlgH family protein [Odoribacter sp.]